MAFLSNLDLFLSAYACVFDSILRLLYEQFSHKYQKILFSILCFVPCMSSLSCYSSWFLFSSKHLFFLVICTISLHALCGCCVYSSEIIKVSFCCTGALVLSVFFVSTLVSNTDHRLLHILLDFSLNMSSTMLQYSRFDTSKFYLFIFFISFMK